MSEVLLATENDLKVILGWLEREYEEDEEGFWSNRCTITRSFREEGDLWVDPSVGRMAGSAMLHLRRLAEGVETPAAERR